MLEVKVVKGRFREAAEYFRRVHSKTPKLASVAAEKAAVILVDHIHNAFHNETDPWGRKWEELSQITIEEREFPGRPILRQTDDLYASTRYIVRRSLFEVFNDAVHAATHQFGLGNVPARPFFPVRSGRPSFPSAWRTAIAQPYIEELRKL